MPEDQSSHDVIDDEVIRSRIRKILGDAPKQSGFQRIISNPLAPILLSFILTGVLGGILSYYLSIKQKSLEYLYNQQQEASNQAWQVKQAELSRLWDQQRADSDRQWSKVQSVINHQRALEQGQVEREGSFAMELSKTRVQRIADIWEKVYLFEADLHGSLERIGEPNSLERETSPKHAEQMKRDEEAVQVRSDELKHSLNKNRFWLGEDAYSRIRKYVESSLQYEVFLMTSSPDYGDTLTLRKLKAKREMLRAQVIQIRNELLRD